MNSIWRGTNDAYQVVGIWGTGVRENYKTTAYELAPMSGGSVRVISRSEFESLREEGVLVPG